MFESSPGLSMPTRPITPGLHALFDYALVAFLLVVPRLLGFSGAVTAIAWAIGLGHLALTLFTNFHHAAARVVPFWAHGTVEAGVASFLVFMGLLTAPGSGTLLLAGSGILLVAALTDYRTADALAVSSAAGRPGTATHPPRDDRRRPPQGWRRETVQPPPSRR
jgi:hypothetical protein